MNGDAIAVEIKEALIEAAIATGGGQLNCTFLRRPEPTGPSYKPVYGDDVEYSTVCLRSRFSVQERAAGLVSDTDQLYLIDASDLAITPAITDRLSVNGVTYEVKSVDVLKFSDVVLMWKVRAAK